MRCKVGQCPAVDAVGRPCILVVAHATTHAATRDWQWSTPAGPVAEVAREFEQAERDAGPIADVPFSLTSPAGTRRAKQGGLF